MYVSMIGLVIFNYVYNVINVVYFRATMFGFDFLKYFCEVYTCRHI